MRKLSTAFITVAAVALLSGANASPFTTTIVTNAVPGTYMANFDDLALGNAGGVSGGYVSVSFSPDGQVITGTDTKWAAPFINDSNAPDPTQYLTTGLGSATLIFPGAQKYVGLLWGSVDLYNTLSFYDGGTLLGSVTGGQIDASANGNRGMGGTYYVGILTDESFDRIVATSSQYAFEFDDVSYNHNDNIKPPEPLTLSLFGAGLVGLVRLRRKYRR